MTLTASPHVMFPDDELDDPFFEPELPPAPRVGRNEPCPCGSGKKYKKCHLDADQAPRRISSEIEPVHEMDFGLVTLMARFATTRFGPDWLGLDPKKENHDALALILPFATWTAEPEKGRNLADVFLEEHGSRLSPHHRQWCAAQRKAWLSVWEVTRVTRGTIGVRDLLTGETRSVTENLGSESVVARDTLLARVIDYDGRSYFGGLHGRSLSPGAAASVVDDVRMKLRLLKAPVPIERLSDPKIGSFLIERWKDAIESED